MASRALSILHAGVVTSVGLTAPSTCAAIRAGLTNPTQTRFVGQDGEPVVGHEVPLEESWRGIPKLARMLVMAIEECVASAEEGIASPVPLVLCVAEQARPGRIRELETLVDRVETLLGVPVDRSIARVIQGGRVGVLAALDYARHVFEEGAAKYLVVAAADSLLRAPTLTAFDAASRLLRPNNSNGFMPGEAAGAILIAPHRVPDSIVCSGIGFATESVTIDSDEPLRGDGLVHAIRNALADASCRMEDLDFRITDIAGEQYYFKEAALALTRLLRGRKETFDLWHPADCIGEVGAAAGVIGLAVALTACQKRYSKGDRMLMHLANDGGERAACVLEYERAAG
jgi:3-oxoacyl-[acyl-carrier-protein] synthase-1